MNKQPVICPWCGSEMVLIAKDTKYNGFIGYYECLECDAESPLVECCASMEEAKEEAYQKAMQKPLGKPMTWQEIKEWPHDWIFLEFDISGDVFAMMPYINPNKPQTLDVYTFDNVGYETYGPYGDGFRCWDHYPTEEERRAAPWKT